MAQVKIEEVVDHLSHEMKGALEDAVREVLPNTQFNREDLYRAFKRAVYRKCSIWEQVPDQYIQP